MFGIIYVTIAIIIAIIAAIKKLYWDGEGREIGLQRRGNGENDSNTWYDSNGIRRDLDTGEYRRVEFNGRLDRLLVDKDGNVLRNLDQEKRLDEAAKEAAKAPAGTKAVYLESWDRKYSKITRKKPNGRIIDFVKGRVYKDIKTGEPYLLRDFNWHSSCMDHNWTIQHLDPFGRFCSGKYYMNLKGKLVCLADEHKFYGDTTMEDCLKFMDYFNQKQDEGGWEQNEYMPDSKLTLYFCNDRS